MTEAATERATPDFVALRHCYENLQPGQRAELRRAPDLEELTSTPALYRLFPGQRPDDRHLRLAFLLPWCRHAAGAPSFGAQLVAAKVSEQRVIQMARSEGPAALVHLRRLAMHVEPAVDWTAFGETLWFWGSRAKRKLVEDFYLAQSGLLKGEKK
jgi:CRISPR system Cascade subunit CasB